MTAQQRSNNPQAKVSWSRRGYKTIYVKESDKTELTKAAEAESDCATLRDYVLKVHRFYQQHHALRVKGNGGSK